MLLALRGSLEAHHGCASRTRPLRRHAALHALYLDRYLPDKAIDLLDEAASRVRVEGSPSRTQVEDLGRGGGRLGLTGVPASAITEPESERLLRLRRRCTGASSARRGCLRRGRAIRRGRVGLSDRAQAAGQLPVLGPTGVGQD